MEQQARQSFYLKSLVSLFVRGGGGLAAFLSSVLVARSLGDVQAGLYFLAFALLNILAVVGRFGLDKTVLRRVSIGSFSHSAGAVKGVILFAFSAVFAGSFFFAALLFLAADFVAATVFSKPELALSLRYIALATPMASLCAICAEALQGLHKFVASMFISAISPAVWLVILLFLMQLYGNSLSSTAACQALWLSYVLTFLFAIYFLRGSIAPSISTTRPAQNEVLESCMPLYVVDMMAIAVLWAGQLLAGHWLAPQDQACLAAAQRTASLASLLLMALNMIVAPRFAALHHQGHSDALRRLAQGSTLAVTFLAIPLVLLMCLIPEQVMSIFGAGFNRAAIVLPILAFGQLINAMTGSVGYLLSMSGHERDLRDITLISGLCAMLLPLLLLPVWGVVGAAVSTVIALSLQNILALLKVRRRLGFWTCGFSGLLRAI